MHALQKFLDWKNSFFILFSYGGWETQVKWGPQSKVFANFVFFPATVPASSVVGISDSAYSTVWELAISWLPSPKVPAHWRETLSKSSLSSTSRKAW